MLALIAEALVPEPRLCTPVLVAPLSELLVAYRNQNCVAAPLGLTVPPSVAELLVTKLAAPVVTVGATMAALTWKLYFAEESEPVINFTHQVAAVVPNVGLITNCVALREEIGLFGTEFCSIAG